MKNLYIYTLNENAEFNKTVWEDVKVTRDKGRIVEKRGADYKLAHGQYKLNENLEKIIVKKEIVEYITFDENTFNDTIKSDMATSFIERYSDEQAELKKQIDKLQEIKDKFLRL